MTDSEKNNVISFMAFRKAKHGDLDEKSAAQRGPIYHLLFHDPFDLNTHYGKEKPRCVIAKDIKDFINAIAALFPDDFYDKELAPELSPYSRARLIADINSVDSLHIVGHNKAITVAAELQALADLLTRAIKVVSPTIKPAFEAHAAALDDLGGHAAITAFAGPLTIHQWPKKGSGLTDGDIPY